MGLYSDNILVTQGTLVKSSVTFRIRSILFKVQYRDSLKRKS